MAMKPVPVRIVSVLKACGRNHANVVGGDTFYSSQRLTGMGIGAKALWLLKLRSLFSSSSYGNPCLDFYFHEVPDIMDNLDTHEYLNKLRNQLLPLSWSHNPLTTLKLICNLLDRRSGTGKFDEQGFYTAACWLHHNHPKTLASNVASIAGSFGGLTDFVQILYRILARQDIMSMGTTDQSFLEVDLCFQENIISDANKVAVERYERDTNYRLLHDQVSDLFAQCLKSDIQNLKNYEDECNSKHIELTLAARACDDRANLLCKSIARKVFEQESEDQQQDRLRKEILMPLRTAVDIVLYECDKTGTLANRSGYKPEFEEEPCLAKKYLEDIVKYKSKITAGALLPHEIIKYVNDGNVGQVAELQWKEMVEDVYLKHGKFKNCLAVCDVSRIMSVPLAIWNPMDVSMALGILVSELSEEPWKGKVINFCQNPQLHSILQEGGHHHDLKSKCELVKSMILDCPEGCEDVDFCKVFDLILQVAVNATLKPEQMINKLFVFTTFKAFEDASASNSCWETDYEAIQSKFKDKGYGDVVPEIVFWNLTNFERTPVRSTKQGVAMLSGVNNNLFKSFLENDGQIGPDQVMEAAISGQGYQSLVVVD